MEMNVLYDKGKCRADTEEEESLLIERLIALKKQLEDDVPKLRPPSRPTLKNVKENIISNKNFISSSKFTFRKSNNRIVNKFLSTKIDNRNITRNHIKNKQNNWPIKTVTSKKNLENVNNNQNTIIKYNLELIELIKNSHMKKSKFFNNFNISLKDNENSEISQLLHNVDQYVLCLQDYLTETDKLFEKKLPSLPKNETNNKVKNVHVNRKFQNQLISNNLLNSNFKNSSNSLVSVKKSMSTSKKKPLKRLSGKSMESPHLIKIGNNKLVRQSLFRTRWKINNKHNYIDKSLTKRKPLSTLQCPTTNTLITSYNRKTKWTNITNPKPTVESKLSNSNTTNKLKWTKPNMLLVNNVNNNNNNNLTSLPKSDKLILFGKNKIIRQSLIHSTQSKTNNYLLKHFSHRLALIRKLKLKNCTPKAKSITTINEHQNILSMKKTINKAVEVKKNGKKSFSMYSYVNPTLSMKKAESSDAKIPRLLAVSHNKSQQNLKVINNNNNVNLTNNKTLRNKKTFTEQLCLVFNRFGVCSKLDQGKCDKRHYKKYITLCTKYLTGECSKEKCNLSHNIVEEKIPFCKHYLNSVCVQLNCPYLHEFRDKKSPICKNFLHGYCTQGKKCPKKHLNLCPIFESKNKCPHGQKCLYPHIQCEDKNDVNIATNEPRYFEITIPNNDETNENDSIHIVPKRGAPLTDLPSFLPLK